MLGRYLLVAPVTEPGLTEAKVYLPEGDWIDFWSKEKITGKRWLQVDVPLNRIPVFIHQDAPMWIQELG